MLHELARRRQTIAVKVGNVSVGGDAPVVVQSMTNTDTADIDKTAVQVAELARAGSELVRITVDRDEAAAAVPHIRDKLAAWGVSVPLVGDFHYIGHKLLTDHPACAEALDKYRINPGNVGFREKRDRQFSDIIEIALRHDKPVRIGVNWGSLDQELLTRLMDENSALPEPKDARAVLHEAMVQSALLSAELAERLGMGRDKIILSAKVSAVQDLISVYAMLSERADYALHLGLTEAGMGTKGIVASTAGIGILLQQGIGDTIRVSLTPEPGGARTREVEVAQQILQVYGTALLRAGGCGLSRMRPDDEHAVPGAGLRHSEPHRGQHAGLAQDLSRRRDAQHRGDGLHRQRTGRVQARRYRHLAARNRRKPGGAGVHRRQEGDDPARPRDCGRFQEAGAGVYREPLRPRSAGHAQSGCGIVTPSGPRGCRTPIRWMQASPRT